MDYNYLKQVKEDVKDAILENYSKEDLKDLLMNSRDEFEEGLNEELWNDDSVTGNASGSYTFSTYEAEEIIAHNWDLLKDALNEFGCDYGEALDKGAEYCDVSIRCYLLPQAIAEVLDKLEKELND
ncbi:hypothetical protein [Clostridium sp.]|uniref:hypothetical protein n=1 Tax=Clostridium sp. TaxID=1506 RepID=UPI0025C08394|nr:hypothetical protein [Clostridium sp.]